MLSKRLVRKTVRLIKSARQVVPHFGIAELSDADLAALARQSEVTLNDEDPDPFPWFEAPDSERGTALFLAPALPPALRTALILRAVARFWPVYSLRDQDAADLFAVAGVFYYDGRLLGNAWQKPRARELRYDLSVWTGRSLGELFRLANQVSVRTDPVEAAPGSANFVAQQLVAEGRRLRSEGETTEAVLTFRSAYRHALDTGDRATALWAMLGASKAYALLGNYREARAVLRAARRRAHRLRLRELYAVALHNSFSLAVEMCQTALARRLEARAYHAYPPGHENLPRLARDGADFRISIGEYARSLPIVLETIHHARTVSEELQGWGSIARAAGGAGDRECFANAVAQFRRREPALLTGEHLAESLLDIGRGAAMLGLRSEALRFGRDALEVATLRKEARIIFEADALLESSGREAQAMRAALFERATRTQPDSIAEAMVSTLRERRMARIR